MSEMDESEPTLDADDASGEALLEHAFAAVRDDKASAGSETAAAQRVARALSLPATSVGRLTDYSAQIPAYLAGTLNDAQRMLFEDEVRASIPLRRALAAAQAGRSTESVVEASVGSRPKRNPGTRRWPYALAAGLLLAIGAGYFLPTLDQAGPVRLASVENVEGQSFRRVGDRWLRLSEAEWIHSGARLATKPKGTVLLEFEDGTKAEIAPRSQVRLTRERGGNRIRVDHGDVIVQVAPQRDGTFDIATNDLVVAVVGTTLGVSHGTKGSRVAVIEGEVEVRHDGKTTSVQAGDQYGTRKTKAMALEKTVAWSRDAERYAEILRAYADLQRDIGAAMATGSRHSTRLLDLVPEATSVYVAVPNAPATIAEAFAAVSAFRERLSLGAFPTDESEMVDEMVDWLGGLGNYLGPETVFALHWDDSGSAVLLLAEAREGLRNVIETKLREVAETVDDQDIDVDIVDEPEQAKRGRLAIWVSDGLLAASASPTVLKELGATLAGSPNPFRNGKLYARLADVYEQGAEYLAGADLVKLELDGFQNAVVDFRGAQTAIAEHRLDDPLGLASLEVRFEGDNPRRVALLDRPGPMGALKFFSPDATLAGAVVLPDSAALAAALDDWPVSFGDDEAPVQLAEGLVDLLGGEIAVALDGPLLPEPSWKAVVEVYDQTRLQQAIESWSGLLGGLSGSEEFGVEAVAGTSSGETTYRLNVGGVDVHYAYIDGYLVLAGSGAVLELARQTYESGVTLLDAGRFQDLLPHDSYLNFSAVTYARLDDSLLLPLVRLAGFGRSGNRRNVLDELRNALEGASVFGIYNEPDRIRVVANGTNIAPLVGLPLLSALGAGRLDGSDDAG